MNRKQHCRKISNLQFIISPYTLHKVMANLFCLWNMLCFSAVTYGPSYKPRMNLTPSRFSLIIHVIYTPFLVPHLFPSQPVQFWIRLIDKMVMSTQPSHWDHWEYYSFAQYLCHMLSTTQQWLNKMVSLRREQGICPWWEDDKNGYGASCRAGLSQRWHMSIWHAY